MNIHMILRSFHNVTRFHVLARCASFRTEFYYPSNRTANARNAGKLHVVLARNVDDARSSGIAQRAKTWNLKRNVMKIKPELRINPKNLVNPKECNVELHVNKFQLNLRISNALIRLYKSNVINIEMNYSLQILLDSLFIQTSEK